MDYDSHMLRLAQVLAIIAVLLICPIRCAHAAAPDAPRAAVSKKCACCHHKPARDSGSHEGSPPAENCECGTCLCHGAVRVADVAAVDLGLCCPLQALPVVTVEIRAVGLPEFETAVSHSDFKRLDGRSTRIACASWLC